MKTLILVLAIGIITAILLADVSDETFEAMHKSLSRVKAENATLSVENVRLVAANNELYAQNKKMGKLIQDLDKKVNAYRMDILSWLSIPALGETKALGVGQTGRARMIAVFQVVDANTMLATISIGAQHRTEGVWISGLATAGHVDGEIINDERVFIIIGTKKYATAAGSTRTVFHLMPIGPAAKYLLAENAALKKKIATME